MRSSCVSRRLALLAFGSLTLTVLLPAAWAAAAPQESDAQERRRRRERGDRREEPGAERKFDLDTWGQIGRPLRSGDGFFELTYYHKDAKGKRRKMKAFVQVDEETKLYADLRTTIAKLAERDAVLLFGRPVTREVPNRSGGGSRTDSQIQNAQVVLTGELSEHTVRSMSFKHPRLEGLKWCRGEIVKSGGGLLITYDGNNTRVTLGKTAPVLRRAELEPEKLKGKVWVQVLGEKSDLRPETGKKSDADVRSFRARTLVVLDRRSVKTAYPLLLEK